MATLNLTETSLKNSCCDFAAIPCFFSQGQRLFLSRARPFAKSVRLSSRLPSQSNPCSITFQKLRAESSLTIMRLVYGPSSKGEGQFQSGLRTERVVRALHFQTSCCHFNTSRGLRDARLNTSCSAVNQRTHRVRSHPGRYSIAMARFCIQSQLSAPTLFVSMLLNKHYDVQTVCPTCQRSIYSPLYGK